MNRQQRRQAVKDLRKKGVKSDVAKKMVEHYSGYDNPLEEGTKVKLNYEMMRKHPDWKNQRDDFKAWVTEHKDEVFTVEWDETRKANDSGDKKFLVCLKEDTTTPKWLFYSSTLIPQYTAKIKLNDGTEVDVGTLENTNTDTINAAVNEALQREKMALPEIVI